MIELKFRKDLVTVLASITLCLAVTLITVTTADAQNPYAQPDNTWISISGTVKAVTADAFTLDYGQGMITVEMDDGDRDADAYMLLPGDEVTVTGKIDDDFYEMTTIEASSVYVEKLGTTFYASALDEEDYWVTVVTPGVLANTLVQGTVTSVSDQEFTLNTGLRSLTVEVDEMFYNPLDDSGYQKIDIGDVVRVTGILDENLFGQREFKADAIVKLVD